MLKNEFTLDDFLNQMKQIKRMGSIGKVLDMLPGMGRLRSQFNFNDQEAQERMKRVEAIILSMTAQERQHANPAKFLNGSRKRRIADGSGTTVQEVNQLMRQFRDMKKMLKDIQRGKMPNIPGMPGMQ
jgi:signal recognition particle subunit SRP54